MKPLIDARQPGQAPPGSFARRARDWCAKIAGLSLIAATLIAPVTIIAAPSANAALGCTRGIQVIGLAGSGELGKPRTAGEASLGEVLTSFSHDLHDSFAGTSTLIELHGIAYKDVGFPDFLTKWGYMPSFDDGVARTRDYLATRCDSEAYVLAGYSQGADAMMAVYNGMSLAQKNRVLGIALFGDPNFNPASSPLDEGTYYQRPAGHGIFGQRPVPSADFQAKARSYCLVNDVVCNSTLKNPAQAAICAAALGTTTTAALVGTKACPDLAVMSVCYLIMKEVIPNSGCPHFDYPKGSTAQAAAFIHDVISPPERFPSGTAATGPMTTPQAGATATKLQNGDVLVAGGDGTSAAPTSSAEIYHPSSNSWTQLSPMSVARGQNHTATWLPDNRVLLLGGNLGFTGTADTAEIFNPPSGTWSPAAHTVSPARNGHAAVLLPTGKVLVAGGYGSAAGTAELYDPVTNAWASTGALTTPRSGATATLLHGGKVLLVGGSGPDGQITPSAEIYDPAKGTWAATGSMSVPRFAHTSAILPDGRVLVAGGLNGSQAPGTVQASVELYNPKTGKWVAAQSMASARVNPVAVTLPNGRVLVAGGGDRDGHLLSTAEFYDPASGEWHLGAVMMNGRALHTMTVLNSGKVLIAGGLGLGTAELYW